MLHHELRAVMHLLISKMRLVPLQLSSDFPGYNGKPIPLQDACKHQHHCNEIGLPLWHSQRKILAIVLQIVKSAKGAQKNSIYEEEKGKQNGGHINNPVVRFPMTQKQDNIEKDA